MWSGGNKGPFIEFTTSWNETLQLIYDDEGEEGREVIFLRGDKRVGVMGGMNAYSNGRSSET